MSAYFTTMTDTQMGLICSIPNNYHLLTKWNTVCKRFVLDFAISSGFSFGSDWRARDQEALQELSLLSGRTIGEKRRGI
jgi:hypothetical protein